MIETLQGTKEIVNYYNNIGIRIFENDKAEDFPIHWHGATEIIMPIENNFYFKIDGQKKTLTKNEILLIPSGQLHSLYAPPKGKRLIILFDTNLVINFKEFDSFLINARPYTIISKDNSYNVFIELFNLLKEIVLEYNSNNSFKEASCYSSLIRFLTIFARNIETMNLGSKKENKKNSKAHFKAISLASNYINENYTNRINIEELSDVTGYSSFHFSKLFKEYSGETIYSYITKIRILQAERLLLNPELTIMEVATLSGFESIATFNRVFKKQKKCTPSQFISLNKVSYNSF